MLEVVLLSYIGFRDFRSHKISHISLLLLTVIGLFDHLSIFNIKSAAITFSIGFITYLFFGVGAGDVKLATVLVLLFISHQEIVDFLKISLILSLPISILTYLHSRRIRSDIALGPMLCGAVLLLHLGVKI